MGLKNRYTCQDSTAPQLFISWARQIIFFLQCLLILNNSYQYVWQIQSSSTRSGLCRELCWRYLIRYFVTLKLKSVQAGVMERGLCWRKCETAGRSYPHIVGLPSHSVISAGGDRSNTKHMWWWDWQPFFYNLFEQQWSSYFDWR